MNHSHEILAGIGLGDMHFGISKEIVVETYGEPNEKELPDEMSNMEYWHYDDKDLSLAFDLDNNEQLISIAISSEKYILERTSFIGMSMADVIEQLHELVYDELETNEEVIASEDLGINFWLDDSVCTEIQWSPKIIAVIEE